MRSRIIPFLLLTALISLAPTATLAKTSALNERLSGRILLQVQSRGEGWYVDPVTRQRFYLGTANDAYALMRLKGLGVRHTELMTYVNGRFPARLSGRILLDVEQRGEAYYVVPGTLRGVFLGQATDAYRLMREYGLGITNNDLALIPVGFITGSITQPTPSIPAPTPSSPAPSAAMSVLERSAFDRINEHRRSVGLSTLTWNASLADIARTHSQNMAQGQVPFGHDGFDNRFDQVQARIGRVYLGENVASNTFLDPVPTAVQGWLNSPGHKANIENTIFSETGIGVAQSRDEEIFFTQLFIGSPSR